VKQMFLGVDGGGTKTEFVCIDEDGHQLASITTGTTYHLEVGIDEAVRRLTSGVAAICTALRCQLSDLTYVFFGLPAYGEDHEIDPRLHSACGALLASDRFTCGNDMICGWAGSLACEDGINIVAGTGSIGYGERLGRTARAGGWGEIFGDEGSGYWIALQGLIAFARMSDGRASRGPLHRHIASALSLTADLDLCERVMGPNGMGREGVAALAPLVCAAAADGDASAQAILTEAAQQLCDIACAVRQSLGYVPGDRVPISWSGSILTQVEPVRRQFVDLLRNAGDFDLVSPRHAPAYGAALYARRAAASAQRR